MTAAGVLLRGLSCSVSLLPAPAALAVGRGLGWLLGSALRYRRAEIFDTLGRCFPEKTEQERRIVTDRMFANLGMTLAEILRLRRIREESVRQTITWEGSEQFHAAWARGKGVLVLAAHMGNWELMCTVAPCCGVRPFTLVAKTIRDAGVNEFIAQTRGRFGGKTLPAHNSYRACLTALRHNEVLAFVLDQNMTYPEGIFVEFFGQPANTTPGLALLSAQSGAPVVPIFGIRRGGAQHQWITLPPIEPPPDRKPETIRSFTQFYTRVIEDVVRAHPDQWLWLHRRWKTKPRGDMPTSSQGLRNPKKRASADSGA